MRLFLTGATGYIGTALCLRLRAAFALEFLDRATDARLARCGERAEVVGEIDLHVLQQHAVLRALGAGQ